MSQDELVSDLDLYERDFITISEVTKTIQQRIGANPPTTNQAYKREIVERFQDAGFVVDVRLFNDENEDHLPEHERHWFTKIVLTDRCEPIAVGEFDHERQGHEVRSDIRGLNKQGDIQKKPVGQAGFSVKPSGLIAPN